MESFKKFTGKSLDDAIKEACAFFNTSREQLEIDIIQDAKSGIFGLVGARKAIVNARRVVLRDAVEDILGRSKKVHVATEKNKSSVHSSKERNQEVEQKKDFKDAKAEALKPELKQSLEQNIDRDLAKEDIPVKEKKAKNEKKQGAKSSNNTGHKEKSIKSNYKQKDYVSKQENNKVDKQLTQDGGMERAIKDMNSAENNSSIISKDSAIIEQKNNVDFIDELEEADNSHFIPLEDLDQEVLFATTREAITILTKSIVGDVPISVKIHEGRVYVHLDCEENSGLLIGREGQTLASIQYLTSRIVSRFMNTAVRVQLDAGDYRTRQDDKLIELANILAERVRATGKSHSTRPLSSYHRRIVHVALQEATDLITRSSGDGQLKRVIIQRKRY